jgi:hypothetical protein
MTQLPLISHREPSVVHLNALVSHLRVTGWQTRRQLVDALGWTDRDIRAVAAMDERLIVRGQKGFNASENCTVEELREAAKQRIAQGRKDIRTGISWQRLACGRVG